MGGLKDNKYRHASAEYTLPQHGFAHRSLFIAAAVTGRTAAFYLASSAETGSSTPSISFCG